MGPVRAAIRASGACTGLEPGQCACGPGRTSIRASGTGSGLEPGQWGLSGPLSGHVGPIWASIRARGGCPGLDPVEPGRPGLESVNSRSDRVCKYPVFSRSPSGRATGSLGKAFRLLGQRYRVRVPVVTCVTEQSFDTTVGWWAGPDLCGQARAGLRD